MCGFGVKSGRRRPGGAVREASAADTGRDVTVVLWRNSEVGDCELQRTGLESFLTALMPNMVDAVAPPRTAIVPTAPRPKRPNPPPAAPAPAAPAPAAPATAATADAVMPIVAVCPAKRVSTGDRPITVPLAPTTSTM